MSMEEEWAIFLKKMDSGLLDTRTGEEFRVKSNEEPYERVLVKKWAGGPTEMINAKFSEWRDSVNSRFHKTSDTFSVVEKHKMEALLGLNANGIDQVKFVEVGSKSHVEGSESVDTIQVSYSPCTHAPGFWLVSNAYHHVTFGNSLMQSGDIDEQERARRHFLRAIELGHGLAPAAHFGLMWLAVKGKNFYSSPHQDGIYHANKALRHGYDEMAMLPDAR